MAAFAAESGYYSIYCKQGLKLKDLEYFYKLLAEAEAPRLNFDEAETLIIEQLQDLRRVDGIVEPIFTQDRLPEILIKKGVTQQCFERALFYHKYINRIYKLPTKYIKLAFFYVKIPDTKQC